MTARLTDEDLVRIESRWRFRVETDAAIWGDDATFKDSPNAQMYRDNLCVIDELRAARTRLAEFEAAAMAFRDEVERADQALQQRGRGGQHVPFHGDFVAASPSVIGRLKWWANRLLAQGGGK